MYASGVVWEERAAPDKGVKVIMAEKTLFTLTKQRLQNHHHQKTAPLARPKYLLNTADLAEKIIVYTLRAWNL